MAARGPVSFVIAAPASGSGKTVVTLGLLRHFRNAGLRVASFKVGPDYIDPAYHAAATGAPCRNLDPWAMRPETLDAGFGALQAGAEVIVGEGVMGLFDGATDGSGSTADLAQAFGLPVVLVVDAGAQAASAAAVVHGFASFRPGLPLAGVIFNRTGGVRHREILEAAMAEAATPVLGCIPRDAALALPERHLGLVQAAEHAALDAFFDRAAAIVAEHVDTQRLRDLRGARPAADAGPVVPIPPLGERIAVARDDAFAFAYPHVLEGWRQAGAAIATFSPLADEPPPPSDAIYLPGGYPELHAGRLASNRRFLSGLRQAAAGGVVIHGECGGYMTLGEALVDSEGRRHAMAGLLPVETSFAERRLHLGYRQVTVAADGPLGPSGTGYRGHEFHYCTVVREDGEDVLFRCRDALGRDLGPAGRRVGSVFGSWCHLIDRAD